MEKFCYIYIILYLILYVIYTQCYKITTKTCKDTSALTVLLRFTGGITSLLFIPLFVFKLPNNITSYLLLGLACIFFALADRMYTASLKELEVSTYSILGQLSTTFIFIIGIIIFKEPIIIKRIIGAILIILANILALYKKKKIQWNKYYLYNILANTSLAIGISLSIGLSDSFNIPLYVAISLCASSILIFIFEKINIKEVINEYKIGSKKEILIVGVLDGVTSILMLRAYQLGSITIIAPLISLKTILNVIAARLILNEKEQIPKKLFLALIIILGVILINS